MAKSEVKAVKALFSVTCGVIPEISATEHTRQWVYTSDDYDADQALPPMPEGHQLDLNGPLDQPHMSQFSRMLIESQRYAGGLIHPSHLNWVKHEWIWL
jgi:hypothetical protein